MLGITEIDGDTLTSLFLRRDFIRQLQMAQTRQQLKTLSALLADPSVQNMTTHSLSSSIDGQVHPEQHPEPEDTVVDIEVVEQNIGMLKRNNDYTKSQVFEMKWI
jgi:hypothetical protein